MHLETLTLYLKKKMDPMHLILKSQEHTLSETSKGVSYDTEKHRKEYHASSHQWLAPEYPP